MVKWYIISVWWFEKSLETVKVGKVRLSMGCLVSVIIPVYNVAPYLKECVDSVCQQTYQNLEILLIDDGSTDGSGQMCDAFAQQDDRIRVYHKANAGLSEARNDGIKRSSGEYLYFIDSDDYLIDDRTIEKMVQGARQFDVSLVVAAYQRVNHNLVNHCVKIELMPEPIVYQAQDMIEKMYQYDRFSGNFIVVHNKLYKRNLFDDYLFPAGRIHEDEFVIYKLYLKAEQVLWLPYETYAYRMRANSIMRSPYSLKRLDIIDAYEERIEVLTQHQLPVSDTILALMNHLSYHHWTLVKLGFSDQAKLMQEKIRYYYKQCDFVSPPKQRIKLALIRYGNYWYRQFEHGLYRRLKRFIVKKIGH